MEHHSGGCQCGAIRYQIKGPMGRADICHCRMCQKAFGSWGAVLVRVKLKDVSWSKGALDIFRSSACVERGFCKECGTPLSMFEKGDDFIDLAVGSLDKPNLVQLTSQIGVESKLSWFDSLHRLPTKTTEQDRAPAQASAIVSLQYPDFDRSE